MRDSRGSNCLANDGGNDPETLQLLVCCDDAVLVRQPGLIDFAIGVLGFGLALAL